MADIRVDVGGLTDGMSVSFKAPCDCTAIGGLKVYYTKDQEKVSKSFVFKDAHGNDLTGIGNLFSEGAYVHALLDTVNGFAYIQNADTNGYIEGNFHKRILGHNTNNGVDISAYKSFSNTYTVPEDGVIYAAVNGSTVSLNNIQVVARTPGLDGGYVGSFTIGNVCNGMVAEGTTAGTGVFPVYKGQKVYYNYFGSTDGIDKIYFYPYYYG